LCENLPFSWKNAEASPNGETLKQAELDFCPLLMTTGKLKKVTNQNRLFCGSFGIYLNDINALRTEKYFLALAATGWFREHDRETGELRGKIDF
jgi:hypothetical protein